MYGSELVDMVLLYLTGHTIQHMLKNRTATVQLHAVANGITGIVAGAASLVAAKMRWDYVILTPCISHQ